MNNSTFNATIANYTFKYQHPYLAAQEIIHHLKYCHVICKTKYISQEKRKQAEKALASLKYNLCAMIESLYRNVDIDDFECTIDSYRYYIVKNDCTLDGANAVADVFFRMQKIDKRGRLRPLTAAQTLKVLSESPDRTDADFLKAFIKLFKLTKDL